MRKTLVAYFSASGVTARAAKEIAQAVDADLYEIRPAEPYTDADLNWMDKKSRSTREMNDPACRPAIAEPAEHMEQYDTVFVGFPIWWGNMPRILYTFFDACDLSGKTIAPFCTSGGSGISAAVEDIARLEPDATVTEGLRAGLGQAEESLGQWLNDIGL